MNSLYIYFYQTLVSIFSRKHEVGFINKMLLLNLYTYLLVVKKWHAIFLKLLKFNSLKKDFCLLST